MLQYNADPRDGGQNNFACDACCCQPLPMLPGETNLIEINYAPWSLQIGNPGIMPGTEFNVEVNDTACASGMSGGFLPPTHSNQLLTTATSTPLEIDLTTGVAPDGNTFSYAIVPFSGPRKGTLIQSAAGVYTYTPNGGVTGKDYFSFEVTDAQGRAIIRHGEIDIGSNFERRDNSLLSLVPFVDQSKVVIDQRTQVVRIPIYMPLSCEPCERYKLTIRQVAQDCICTPFSHFMCFDVTCKPCG